MDNKKFARLPKWAKNEIERLNANIEYYKKQVQEIKGEKDTNVFIVEGLTKRPLPKNSHIEFRLGKNWSDKVDINIEEDCIQIYLDDVIVIPSASNHLYLKRRRR